MTQEPWTGKYKARPVKTCTEYICKILTHHGQECDMQTKTKDKKQKRPQKTGMATE